MAVSSQVASENALSWAAYQDITVWLKDTTLYCGVLLPTGFNNAFKKHDEDNKDLITYPYYLLTSDDVQNSSYAAAVSRTKPKYSIKTINSANNTVPQSLLFLSNAYIQKLNDKQYKLLAIPLNFITKFEFTPPQVSQPAPKESLPTDAEVKVNKSNIRPIDSRLKEWKPENVDFDDKISLDCKVEAWDQFKTNKELFNVSSNYNELDYTTEIKANQIPANLFKKLDKLEGNYDDDDDIYDYNNIADHNSSRRSNTLSQEADHTKKAFRTAEKKHSQNNKKVSLISGKYHFKGVIAPHLKIDKSIRKEQIDSFYNDQSKITKSLAACGLISDSEKKIKQNTATSQVSASTKVASTNPAQHWRVAALSNCTSCATVTDVKWPYIALSQDTTPIYTNNVSYVPYQPTHPISVNTNMHEMVNQPNYEYTNQQNR